jgi:hypothetical protein
MTDTLQPLGEFEGHPVTASGIEIRNAAGGLTDALKVDPIAWADDEEITVVMRCKVKALRFDQIKDGDGEDSGKRRRVHIMNATEATVVDDEFASKVLKAQRERIAEAKADAAKGPLDSELLTQELEAEHDEGAHELLPAEGCPVCFPDGAE